MYTFDQASGNFIVFTLRVDIDLCHSSDSEDHDSMKDPTEGMGELSLTENQEVRPFSFFSLIAQIL